MGCGSRAGKMEMHSAGKPQVEQEYCVVVENAKEFVLTMPQ